MPRKTKLTPSVHDGIVRAVELGVSLFTAAGHLGIKPATASEWLARGQGTDPLRPPTALYARFAEGVLRARCLDELRRLTRLEAAASGGIVISRKTTTYPDGRVVVVEEFAPPDWRADAFVLERSRPLEWGKRAQVDVKVDIQKAAAVVADQLGLTPEAVIAEAQAILQRMDEAD